MNKQPVLNILKDIFQAYGYEIDTSYICDLVASRGTSERIYIKLDPDIDYNSMHTFADSMKHTEGIGLYILSNTSSDDVSDYAARHDLIFWDQHDMENRIGKAILANATGQTMELLLNSSASDKPTNVFETSDVEEPKSTNIFDMFNTPTPPGPEPTIKGPDSKTPANIKQEAPHPTSADVIKEEPLIRIQLPSMPINMAKTSALKVADTKITEIRDFLLKFIPYYSYTYDFDTKRKFRSKVIDLNAQGDGIINAITAHDSFTRFPKPLEYIEVPVHNYQIKEPHITDKEAIKVARDAIIEKHSQVLKLDEVKGDAIIYESKTVSPLEKDINITIMLVYVPVWEIRGKSNSIDINAYNGHVMDEPVDDDVEFV